MRKKIQSKIERIKKNLATFIQKQPRNMYGHGYVWAHACGYKVLIGSIDGRENHDKIIAKALSYAGVTTVWINLD